jgi:hypothetical protein
VFANGRKHNQRRASHQDLRGGRIWRHELNPADDGTRLRETWNVSEDKQKAMITGGSTPKPTEVGIRATPERIAELLEG